MLRSSLFVLCFAAAPAFADGVEDMVKMQERQSAAVASNAPDCDKIAKALMATVDEDVATLKKVIASEASKSKEEKKAAKEEMMTKYGPRLKDARTKMEPMKACKDNANVKAWKAKFDEATAPPKK